MITQNPLGKHHLLSLLTFDNTIETGVQSNFRRPPAFLQENELIIEDKFVAEYYGERAIRVKQKFHDVIKEVFNRILAKYDFLHPQIIIASCDAQEGYFLKPNLVGATSGSFLVGGSEMPTVGLAALVHELGHYKGTELYGDASIPLPEFENLYREIASIKNMNAGLTHSFKDGNFVNSSSAGHPQDNAGELYASAFMIAEMGFIPKYKGVFFSTLNEEQKQLAERIFEFVQRGGR